MLRIMLCEKESFLLSVFAFGVWRFCCLIGFVVISRILRVLVIACFVEDGVDGELRPWRKDWQAMKALGRGN